MNYGNVPPPGYERRTAPSKVSQFGGDARLSETEKLKKVDYLIIKLNYMKKNIL